MTEPDPKKLLFFYSNRNDPHDWIWRRDKTALATFPHATTHELKDCGTKEAYACLLDTITSHVAEHGTLHELIIDGHGGSDGKVQVVGYSHGFAVTDLLNDLEAWQTKNHTKVTDRLVFTGCEVLKYVNPEQVDYYRKKAQSLGTEIVGSDHITYDGGILAKNVGRFIQFTPAGEVRRDKILDEPVGYRLASVGGLRSKLQGGEVSFPYQDSWFKCHAGHTQEEGAKCQEAHLPPVIHSPPPLATPAFPQLKTVCEHAVDAECRGSEFVDAQEPALPVATPKQSAPTLKR